MSSTVSTWVTCQNSQSAHEGQWSPEQIRCSLTDRYSKQYHFEILSKSHTETFVLVTWIIKHFHDALFFAKQNKQPINLTFLSVLLLISLASQRLIFDSISSIYSKTELQRAVFRWVQNKFPLKHFHTGNTYTVTSGVVFKKKLRLTTLEVGC